MTDFHIFFKQFVNKGKRSILLLQAQKNVGLTGENYAQSAGVERGKL